MIIQFELLKLFREDSRFQHLTDPWEIWSKIDALKLAALKIGSKVILYVILFLNFLKFARVLFNCVWLALLRFHVNSCCQSKKHYLGSCLFPNKASHNNEQLDKILFSNDICFLSYVELNFWCCLYSTCTHNEWVFIYNFFAATALDILFDNSVLFLKCVHWYHDTLSAKMLLKWNKHINKIKNY